MGTAPAARILRWGYQHVGILEPTQPDAKPKICVLPDAKPKRKPVEYRLRWVPTQNTGVGHVHFMFFVLISFALGTQRIPSFQWNMGLSPQKRCVTLAILGIHIHILPARLKSGGGGLIGEETSSHVRFHESAAPAPLCYGTLKTEYYLICTSANLLNDVIKTSLFKMEIIHGLRQGGNLKPGRSNFQQGKLYCILRISNFVMMFESVCNNMSWL